MSLFSKSFQLFKAIQDVNLKKVNNATLLDLHRKCHMLYMANIHHKNLNKKFLNSLVKFHDEIVREMLKRNMKHSSPLKKV